MAFFISYFRNLAVIQDFERSLLNLISRVMDMVDVVERSVEMTPKNNVNVIFQKLVSFLNELE